MGKKIVIDPLTRIEGHLAIEAEVEDGKVKDAMVKGEMFRGIEMILQGRDPRDAQHITQRICGVCPACHAQAAAICLDDAFNVTPPENGRLLRNLILGANFIASHILHFYHLAALDYVDITAILKYTGRDAGLNKVKEWAKAEVESGRQSAVSPFLPRWEGDYISDVDVNINATANYLQALDMRRIAQEALTIFGGKMPHEVAVVPGGVTEKPSVDKIAAYLWRIKKLQTFIENSYIPDVVAVAKTYPNYFSIGIGSKNLLAYGGFRETVTGSEKLLSSGVYIDGSLSALEQSKIREYVQHSRYADECGDRHPKEGVTRPDIQKASSYSWLKSPRYDDKVMEVGPLARMVITHLTGKNQKVSNLVTDTLKALDAPVNSLFSVLGRHAARALECKVIADRCAEWVTQLKPEESVCSQSEVPNTSEGIGLTEAPRGALGHWLRVEGGKIANYQVITPTNWNCSPRDNNGQLGAVEQALLGTPVADPDNPIELARVVRSFDPCLACSVHLITPDEKVKNFKIV